MQLEKLPLFKTKREFFIFILASGFILCYSLLIEFNNYKNLTKFDSNIVSATILKHYTKTKTTTKGKTKTYQILKLKADRGFSFYTMQNKLPPHAKGSKITLEIWASKISFYQYMNSFFTFSKVIQLNKTPSPKQKLNSYISSCHTNKNISEIYQALYTATPLDKKLQQTFSYLGISHLVAISGFHLGVLSVLLFFIFKTPYTFFQNRYFPYRSYKLDSFIIISSILLLYLLFLDSPASLLRAFVMFVVGFGLYERGFKIISMQTLFLTAVLILSFFPRLFFSLGFWLSVGGVYYIYLFLLYFKKLGKIYQFVLLPVWVYLMMLPHSLFIFKSFSLWHPLSIIWSILFSIFYPLSILFHILGIGDLLDNSLVWLINIPTTPVDITISWYVELLFILISILAIPEISRKILLSIKPFFRMHD
jgi:competence protein ComEC